MKKIFTLLLALTMLVCITVVAFSAGEQTGTTTIRATVPNAGTSAYNIHIPSDLTLTYLDESDQTIGNMYISNVTGNPEVWCKISYTDLTCGSSTIPVQYKMDGNAIANGVTVCVYNPTKDEYYTSSFTAKVTASNWSDASPGTYTATITFDFYIQ